MSTPQNKDFVVINIKDSSDSYPPNSKLYRNLCSCNLALLDPQREEWLCTRCNVSYFPNKGEKVKRANKFETPGDEPNVIVQMVNDSTMLRPKKPSFPESLKRPGVTITDFNSTVDGEAI
jgi:hypothetical protein